jgi:hypothetical protein
MVQIRQQTPKLVVNACFYVRTYILDRRIPGGVYNRSGTIIDSTHIAAPLKMHHIYNLP